MSKRSLLFLLGVVFSIISIFLGYQVMDKIDNALHWVLIWIVLPISGLFKLHRFRINQRMTIHLVSFEADHRDGQILTAIIALLFTLIPALYAVNLMSEI